jgi:hypothetical protein
MNNDAKWMSRDTWAAKHGAYNLPYYDHITRKSPWPMNAIECRDMGWQEYMAYSDAYELHIYAPANADLDDVIDVFCMAEFEMISIAGYLFSFEAISE